MKRRDVFWLALAVALLVPFIVTVISASVGIAEFAIISTLIIIVAVSLAGRSLLRNMQESAAREREANGGIRRPALLIGLGVLGFALLGLLVAAALSSAATPATPAEEVAAPTPVVVEPAGPREVNPVSGLTGALIGAVVGAGILFAVYLFFSRNQPAPAAPEEPVADTPAFDWREMLAGDDDSDEDVAWWVQQLSRKNNPKR